jgi:hypothetical protein
MLSALFYTPGKMKWQRPNGRDGELNSRLIDSRGEGMSYLLFNWPRGA